MMIIEILMLIVWFVCGYYAAGYDYATSQRQCTIVHPSKTAIDRWGAFTIFVLGAAGLAIILARGRTRHGREYPWSSTRWRV